MRRARAAVLQAALLALPALRAPAEEAIASAAEILGFDPAGDGAILTSADVARCLRQWAAATPRLRVETIGLSTAGRPILCAAVSGPENLSNLDAASWPPGVARALVTCGVHPLEVAATPAGLLLVHRLIAGHAPRAQELLQQVMVLVVPCLSPDGTDRVAAWLRSGAGDVDSRLPFLQHRYAGHDLNRDWLVGTQPETRAVIERLHLRRRPWLTIDVHQMESFGPRLFVPPYVEPFDPDIPVGLLEHTERLGARVLDRLTQSGRRGVARRWTYDAWTPSRAFPFYHNGVRFLLEAASGVRHRPLVVDSGSLRIFAGANDAGVDHPAPWQGGRWGLPEAVDYLVAAAELALEALVDEPWRSAARAAAAGEPGRVRLAGRGGPAGAAGARLELLGTLELGGALLWRAADGGAWIAADAPWARGWCRTLTLPKLYPEAVLRRVGTPYDASGHDLAALAGWTAAAIGGGVPAGFERARAPTVPPGEPRRRARGVLHVVDPGASADEGWLRWTLEDRGFEFERRHLDELDTARFEVGSTILLPDAQEPPGREAARSLARAVQSGARVIAIGSSARAVVQATGAELAEASTAGSPIAGAVLSTRWAEEPEREPLSRGLPSPPCILQGRGPIWAIPPDSRARAVLVLADEPLHSGLLTSAQRQAVQRGAVVVRIAGDGGGEWVLFGFSPCFRGWTLAAEQVLWNALAD